MDDDIDRLKYRVRDAVAEVLANSPIGPDEGGVLVDFALAMGWHTSDDGHMVSTLTCGSPWAVHGLMRSVLSAWDTADAESAVVWFSDDDDEGEQ